MTLELEEAARLNEEAYLALHLMRADILSPVLNLLRSDAQIDPFVRQALADAFAGRRAGEIVRFKIEGANPENHVGLAIHRFHRDVAIARFVASERHKGKTRAEAELAASEIFLRGPDLCHKAVGMAKRMDAWIEQNLPHRPDRLNKLNDADWQMFREEQFRVEMHRGKGRRRKSGISRT